MSETKPKNKPARPVPHPIEPVNAQFWEQCQGGVLHFQKCDGCNKFRHLPRNMCAFCGSPDWKWAPSKGKGKLYSWTIAHMPMHPAFVADVPYVAAVVELEEGVRLVSLLRSAVLEDLVLDMPVKVQFERVTDSFQLPVFVPA
ncbi:MAG: Zn-ribbon domain-containing OB-fold protein [Pseudomonadota bacterium]|jgi:uncharacterized protein